MKNLTVARRLMLGFGVVLVLLLLVSIAGIRGLNELNGSVQDITQDKWKKVSLLQNGLSGMNNISIAARDMALNDTAAGRQAARERLLAGRTAIDETLQGLDPIIRQPRARELLGQIETVRTHYVEVQDEVMRRIESGQLEAARQYLEHDFFPVAESFRKLASELVMFQDELVDQGARQAQAQYGQARVLMMAMAGLALLFAFGIAAWIVRSVTRPLGGEPQQAREVAERIAAGDLTATIRVAAGDDHSLMAAMRQMQTSLREMIARLKADSEGVASAAGQLASSSAQVAAATEHQSEAASAMAAAVEEMTVSINHVSESAQEAHDVTAQTGERSSTGSRVIGDTVDEMRRISATVGEAARTIQAMGESSQNISGIVRVIKDVAEQTNLLALNAAIEAARAGEQGRGFAVVADEVRKLAERTAQATGEISHMIEDVQSGAQAAVRTMEQTVLRVEEGVGLAQRANDSMADIRQGSDQVVQAVNDISSALQEQGVASNEIAANVEKIAQMSEENSAATREAAETAQALERLAANTREAVARFRV